MTKKEQAEIDSLRNQLRLARALRFTEEVLPDVPPPSYNGATGALSTGFVFNAYNGFSGDSVTVGCSSSISHATGRTDKATSQGSIALFYSQLLALRAMRHVIEMECATRLANVDKQIEQALATN